MTELVLSFTPPPCAELVATRFSHPHLTGPISARLGAYDRCFKWSAGVRALTALLLRTAAWARNERGAHTQPSLEGGRPSMAASLNDVLTSKPQWVADVFGEAGGRPVLTELIGRWNADFNTCASAPVRLWLECDRLPPDQIRVEVDGRPVDNPSGLVHLADDVCRQCGRGKVAPETEADDAPGGVGVRVDLGPRRVTVEVVLDRDYDAFTAEDEERLLQAIRTVLRTSREIPARGRRRGSVIVTLDLTAAEAEELVAAAATDRLTDHRVVAVRVLSPTDVPAPEHTAAPVPPAPAPGAAGLHLRGGESRAWNPLSRSDLLQTYTDRWDAGDRTTTEELLRAAGARLERLARRMTRLHPNAYGLPESGDVLQNSLIRLLRTLQTLRPATTRDFFALAAVHIRRELIDLARRYKSRERITGDRPTEGSAAPQLAAESFEYWVRFHEAVDELPAEERDVVGLLFYHGWPQGRIAELYQVDERTIRRIWASACELLREAVG